MFALIKGSWSKGQLSFLYAIVSGDDAFVNDKLLSENPASNVILQVLLRQVRNARR